MKKQVEIDNQLIQEAMASTGAASAEAVVEIALRQLVKGRSRRDLTELAGRIEFSSDFDHKALRELRRNAG